MEHVKTCEFVSPKHPDKLCDYIADSLLDRYLEQDPESRVAIEAMGGHGNIYVVGEITSRTEVDVVRVVRDIVGDAFTVHSRVTRQSPEIARGVDAGGAGDQGIMIGYATSETKTFMPREYELARALCRELFEVYPYDGKVQVTLRGDAVQAVVASFQNAPSRELRTYVERHIAAESYFVNPGGDWGIGGFEADTGLTGRKLLIDNYGPQHRIGGGSFSGKDCTKVDRSGAYMARRIAVDYLKKYSAREVVVRLAYAIGKAEPVMAQAMIDGKDREIKDYDLRPRAIREYLKLETPIYRTTAEWGHFGNGFPWG